jgi:hypothetical protein
MQKKGKKSISGRNIDVSLKRENVLFGGKYDRYVFKIKTAVEDAY